MGVVYANALRYCASVEAKGQPYLVPSFIVLYFFTYTFKFVCVCMCVCICMCLYVCGHTHMPGLTCGDLRTTCRSRFSSSQHVGPKD